MSPARKRRATHRRARTAGARCQTTGLRHSAQIAPAHRIATVRAVRYVGAAYVRSMIAAAIHFEETKINENVM